MPKPGQPIFNHVAMSMPSAALSPEGRKEIVDFYSEVFGWQELPTETIDGQRLVMMAYRIDQFVFLIADDTPLKAPRLDHFGMGVATVEELDNYLERAKRYQERDSRVDIIDKQVEQHPGVAITNFYAGFLLPLMVEVQHFAYA
ncbi:MAG: hypothetical protein ACYDH6_04115 [Acidimicrobiales bacterium]